MCLGCFVSNISFRSTAGVFQATRNASYEPTLSCCLQFDVLLLVLDYLLISLGFLVVHSSRSTPCTHVFVLVIASQWSVFYLSSRLSMLQGSIVPHRPYVWLCGHLHAVLQGESDGHSAECRGVCRHRPGNWDPVRPSDYVGPQCGTFYGGPASGPAGRSGFSGGEEN